MKPIASACSTSAVEPWAVATSSAAHAVTPTAYHRCAVGRTSGHTDVTPAHVPAMRTVALPGDVGRRDVGVAVGPPDGTPLVRGRRHRLGGVRGRDGPGLDGGGAPGARDRLHGRLPARAAIGTVADDPQTAVLAVAGDLGLHLDDVTADSSGLDGAQRFTARGPGGDRVVVDLYGRDYTQAQIWKGLLRYVWYRGSRVPVTANRLQRLEHHLAVLGQANASGATDMRVVAAGLGGPTSDAVLITCPPAGVGPDRPGRRSTPATWPALGLS